MLFFPINQWVIVFIYQEKTFKAGDIQKKYHFISQLRWKSEFFVDCLLLEEIIGYRTLRKNVCIKSSSFNSMRSSGIKHPYRH